MSLNISVDLRNRMTLSIAVGQGDHGALRLSLARAGMLMIAGVGAYV